MLHHFHGVSSYQLSIEQEKVKMNVIKSRQRGMSISSWIFVIVVTLFFGLLGVKMIPTYMEFYSIVSIMESIRDEGTYDKAAHKKIRTIFNRRIDINGIYDFDQKSLKITKERDVILMEIEYQKTEHMAGNVDVIMSFYKAVEM